MPLRGPGHHELDAARARIISALLFRYLPAAQGDTQRISQIIHEVANAPWLADHVVDPRIKAFRPGSAEVRLAAGRYDGELEPLDDLDLNFKLVDQDSGTEIFYKPDSAYPDFTMPGEGANAEILGYRTAELLGFHGLVPETAIVRPRLADEDMQVGSGQRFVNFEEAPSPLEHDYAHSEVDEVAAFHYAMAAIDANRGHIVRATDGPRQGKLMSLDNGHGWIGERLVSEMPPAVTLRSEFIVKHMQDNRDFSPDILAKIRAVDPVEFYVTARASGIEPDAARLGVARLLEMQRAGRITGEASPGPIAIPDLPD